MDQIRQRCAIPEEKMSSLNLTYRCKDPRIGTPMTLEGVNESAFDAAVLCSAVQDKIKHGEAASQATTQRQQQAQQQAAAGEPCVTTAGAGRRRSNVFMSALRKYLTCLRTR